MMYSLIQGEFADWVRDHIEARNRKMTSAHNLLIDMDPDIAEAFSNSTAVSSKCWASIWALYHF